jgi:hypothetical protein
VVIQERVVALFKTRGSSSFWGQHFTTKVRPIKTFE